MIGAFNHMEFYICNVFLLPNYDRVSLLSNLSLYSTTVKYAEGVIKAFSSIFN